MEGGCSCRVIRLRTRTCRGGLGGRSPRGRKSRPNCYVESHQLAPTLFPTGENGPSTNLLLFWLLLLLLLPLLETGNREDATAIATSRGPIRGRLPHEWRMSRLSALSPLPSDVKRTSCLGDANKTFQTACHNAPGSTVVCSTSSTIHFNF